MGRATAPIQKRKMQAKINLTGLAILAAIVFLAYFGVAEANRMGDVEDSLRTRAMEHQVARDFIQGNPGSEPYIIHPSPKGVWQVRNTDGYNSTSSKYYDDEITRSLRNMDTEEAFPSVWILVLSPNNPVREETFLAPHPMPPALYLVFDDDLQLIYQEVVK